MNIQEFRKYGYQAIDWIADFYENIEKAPVSPNIEPGDIKAKLPLSAPQYPEPFENIFKDINEIIMPGITQWQSPNWFGYFPSNASFPSIIGEALSAGIGAQGMVWQTSPSATELEERVMEWLRDEIGLPNTFSGVIQDTASTSTLAAIISARESKSDYTINKSGFEAKKYAIYCSQEAHSSVEKAIKIAGFGTDNLRKIKADESGAMIYESLEEQIELDIKNGITPICIVSAFGTTGSGAIDPIEKNSELAKKYNIWHHIDAAWAGSALIIPKYREQYAYLQNCDSFVFNPHKWMMTNFDCSAYFVKDKNSLISAFTLTPEYLKTNVDDKVNNYRDWGVQLGRRFRALKLWMVIRAYGMSGLGAIIQNHIDIAHSLADKFAIEKDFEILSRSEFALFCFRYKPENISDEAGLEDINKKLLDTINKSGKIFLSHTKLNGKYCIRFSVGQTNTEERHLSAAFELIKDIARR